MSKQAFDRKIEALGSLRSHPDDPATVEQLRKALKDRNNYLVSKAAALAGELAIRALVPDLAAAFDRFLANASKSDPQCWAKNTIAKTLKDLGHDDPAIFLRGISHVQMEPVWGAQVDTAATLRGACAHALVACSLSRLETLTHLVDLLADREKPVRVEAARAMAQLPGPDSVLLLRLKALAGDPEPEVTGQCFVALLELSSRDSLPFVARFLDGEDPDMRVEAAAALGQCHEPEAVDLLKECWNKQTDPEPKRAILLSLGTSRLPVAADFLLSVLENGRADDALGAIEALAAGRFREELRERVNAAVDARCDSKLIAFFNKKFGTSISS